MTSSSTPPEALQHNVYWACPGPILPRSAVKQRFTNAAAPGPLMASLPRWLTSNTPTSVADRGVLGDRAVRVGDGHRPAAERAHRRAEGGVPVVQGAGAQVVHGAGRYRSRASLRCLIPAASIVT